MLVANGWWAWRCNCWHALRAAFWVVGFTVQGKGCGVGDFYRKCLYHMRERIPIISFYQPTGLLFNLRKKMDGCKSHLWVWRGSTRSCVRSEVFIRIRFWSGLASTFSVALTMRLRSHRFSQSGNSDSYFKTYSKFRRNWKGERWSKNTKSKWSNEMVENSGGVELDWHMCVDLFHGFGVLSICVFDYIVEYLFRILLWQKKLP